MVMGKKKTLQMIRIEQDDKDRAGVFQSVTRIFGDGSIGLEKSDLVKNGDNY
jgi:hypothetical protein